MKRVESNSAVFVDKGSPQPVSAASKAPWASQQGVSTGGAVHRFALGLDLSSVINIFLALTSSSRPSSEKARTQVQEYFWTCRSKCTSTLAPRWPAISTKFVRRTLGQSYGLQRMLRYGKLLEAEKKPRWLSPSQDLDFGQFFTSPQSFHAFFDCAHTWVASFELRAGAFEL